MNRWTPHEDSEWLAGARKIETQKKRKLKKKMNKKVIINIRAHVSSWPNNLSLLLLFIRKKTTCRTQFIISFNHIKHWMGQMDNPVASDLNMGLFVQRLFVGATVGSVRNKPLTHSTESVVMQIDKILWHKSYNKLSIATGWNTCISLR